MKNEIDTSYSRFRFIFRLTTSFIKEGFFLHLRFNPLLMKSIVFATANKNKVREVKEVLEKAFDIIGLVEIGCTEEVPETSPTIRGNALQKARYVHQNYEVDCFAEDSGLEIEALNGEPGVLTARYAGPQRDAHANMDLVLNKLKDSVQRKARFITVIALILDQQEFIFEGIAPGSIAYKKSGNGGFGYDPIFIPEGHSISFAEMTPEKKNAISHRGKAVAQLKSFLSKQ